MKEPLKILIAYDGSECADAALEDLNPNGSEVGLLAVVTPFPRGHIEVVRPKKYRHAFLCNFPDEGRTIKSGSIFEPAHFIMERKMMLGIKQRAEASTAD